MLNIHFIGIGGVGMNALAQLAITRGYNISGSDRGYNANQSPYIELKELKISILPQDGSGINSTLNYVVYSTAIESDNIEFEKAKKQGVPLIHRVEFLKMLIPKDAEVIAITGTAGKTTTTGLLGWIFESIGLNPTVYSGAAIINWKKNKILGNIRTGSDKLWIIEADESDRSLLQINPTHTLLTNIGIDHFEEKILQDIFDQFKKQTKEIFHKGYLPETELITIKSKLIGSHNENNIRYALSFCIKYGLETKKVLDAIIRFKGIERRMEYIGRTPKGVKLYDDYAHNPMKIDATLKAISCNISHNAIYAFWRPHAHASFNRGYYDFIKIFTKFLKNKNHQIFILPIYYAGGNIMVNKTSQDLVNEINQTNILHVSNYNDLKEIIISKGKKDDIIVGMGARDPKISHFIKELMNNEYQ